ncbi:MAG: translocation/assembly module TamB domain-containing protein [Opitutaceae bacterium]|nr:translocation/assembly module TamB domain-containing protein [Opitutaceae bacterium]
MRRLLLILLGLAACTLLLAATVPWWLGAALAPVARLRGGTVGAYERIGYSRFALREVEVTVGPVRVTAGRVEADTPLLWLWRYAWGRDAPVTVGDWRVEIAPSSGPRDPDKPRGWMPLRVLLQRIAERLDLWLPRASAGAGVVRWPGDELRLAGATWQARTLTVDDLSFRGVTAKGTVEFAAGDKIHVAIRTTDGVGAAKLTSHGHGVTGDAELWQQRAAVGATFGPRGWLPAEGALRAGQWTIDGEKLRLGGAYGAVRGTANLAWKNPNFTVDVSAVGEPVAGRAVPPLEVTLRGSGDATAFTLETLRVLVPGVTALLTEPVVVERNGRIRDGGARFTLQADLAQLPWLSAQGAVAGDANVVSDGTGAPRIEFAVSAAAIRAGEFQLAEAAARGRLDWPRLEIREGSLRGAEGGSLAWRGGWDFRRREVLAANVEGEVRRASFARWLPAQPGFDTVRLQASAEGPIDRLAHSGTLEAGQVTLPRLRPLAVNGEWRGVGAAIEAWSAVVRAGASEIAARGSADAAAVTLAEASLRQDGAVRLALTTPAVLRWRPALGIEALELAGPEGRIRGTVTLGAAGRIEVAGERIAAAWVHDFLPLPGPAWTIARLGLTGRWDRGPAQFTVDTAVALEIGDGRTALIDVRGGGDGDGLRVEALRVTESGTAVVDARGRLPLVWLPAGATPWRIDPAGELTFAAAVAPHGVFWAKFASLTGVALQDPQVEAKVGGTWERPEGRATLRAVKVEIEPRWTTRPLPVIEDLVVEIDGDRRGLNLTRFDVRLAGQAVQARGRLPMPEERWRDALERPLAVARNGADLQLTVDDAELAAFARLLPAAIAPKGRVQADVRYRNGGVEGFVRLRGAASRPLGPLGIVQEISAEVRLAGRRFTLENVSALSGGQPVTLVGEVTLGDDGSPRYDLTLRGLNLPFVRQTGLLLRGDLDLHLTTPSAPGPARLSGTVKLRDSLFLSDVRALLPQGGAGPTRRPPYFAVEAAPLNAWTLAVDVSGDRFMRVRIPVFTGVASARVRLSGTLGEPRAIGEVSIDEGSIRMPFASFAVTQGTVRLTELDASEPEVFVRGTGRRYGYDLSVEIEGPASQPTVVFSSSPALDSEQVLLMVMAGTAPGNEIARSATQRAANIGLFLGQSLLNSLGADAAEADRLTLMSGEKISRQGRETYEFEYQLSDRWTVTGEYNEFDEYNAGMKWRVFGGRRPVVKPDEKP